jgi:small-conductance mechanosensitive channel
MCAVRIIRIPLTILLLVLPLSVAAPQAQGQQERAGQDTTQARSQQERAGQDTTQAQRSQVVIPVAWIPQRAEAARSDMRAIQERLAPTDPVNTTVEALQAFTEELTSALEDPAFRPGEGASLRTLDGIRRRWTPFQVRLAGWKRTLDMETESVAAERDSLIQTRRLWERTRASAVEEAAPEALLDRVTSLLDEIGIVDIQLLERLDRVLSAVDQVGWAQRSIDEVLAQVESAEITARERLLSRDSPPLWQAILAPADTLTLAGQVVASWRETWREWSSFARVSNRQFVFAIGAFLLYLVLFQALHRQARAWRDRGRWPATSVEFEKTTRFLSRPVSAAVLLAALTWRLAFPNQPAEVGAAIMVALIVPVLRLLPASIARDLRWPMYGLAAVWVLGEGIVLILDGSLLQRLALLVTASLVGAGLYWIVRTDSPIQASATNRWSRAALLAAQLGVFVMGTSVVANVMGLSSLAEILTRATIHSAAAALLMATMATLLDGMIWTLLHTDGALKLRVIRHHSEKLAARVLMLAHIGLFILWLSISARGFGIQRAVLGALESMLLTDLTIGTVAISLGDILAFAVLLWLSLVLARGIRRLLEEDVLQSVSLPRGVPAAISTLAYYAAVFIGFLMAATAAGFDLSRFTLLAGAFGVGLGFGLQNVVNNFVSGLILIFERPVQVGDVVEVEGIQGRVQRIGIRASTVRTWSGAEVIVPNGDLISRQVTNWTLSDRLRRMEIAVGVKYGTDPQQVIDLLTATVIQHPDVLPDPAANVIFQGFGESSLDFVVRAWTNNEDWRMVASDLTVAVNGALKEARIEIPFPQRDLHLRSVDAELNLGG